MSTVSSSSGCQLLAPTLRPPGQMLLWVLRVLSSRPESPGLLLLLLLLLLLMLLAARHGCKRPAPLLSDLWSAAGILCRQSCCSTVMLMLPAATLPLQARGAPACLWRCLLAGPAWTVRVDLRQQSQTVRTPPAGLGAGGACTQPVAASWCGSDTDAGYSWGYASQRMDRGLDNAQAPAIWTQRSFQRSAQGQGVEACV